MVNKFMSVMKKDCSHHKKYFDVCLHKKLEEPVVEVETHTALAFVAAEPTLQGWQELLSSFLVTDTLKMSLPMTHNFLF